MKRSQQFEVIESKIWRRDDGAVASIYGALPWASDSEKPRWSIVVRGFTVRNTVSGVVGVGRIPWPDKASAHAWIDAA